jgi:hypothetical protein
MRATSCRGLDHCHRQEGLENAKDCFEEAACCCCSHLPSVEVGYWVVVHCEPQRTTRIQVVHYDRCFEAQHYFEDRHSLFVSSKREA